MKSDGGVSSDRERCERGWETMKGIVGEAVDE